MIWLLRILASVHKQINWNCPFISYKPCTAEGTIYGMNSLFLTISCKLQISNLFSHGYIGPVVVLVIFKLINPQICQPTWKSGELIGLRWPITHSGSVLCSISCHFLQPWFKLLSFIDSPHIRIYLKEKGNCAHIYQTCHKLIQFPIRSSQVDCSIFTANLRLNIFLSVIYN